MSEQVGIVRLGDLIIDFNNRKIIYRGKEMTTGGVTRPITPPISSEEIADGAVTTSKIADNAVTRAKLEYPTEGVNFSYLSIINKLVVQVGSEYRLFTEDEFTDKALLSVVEGGPQGVCTGRAYGFQKDTSFKRVATYYEVSGVTCGFYQTVHNPDASTADHILRRDDFSPSRATTNLASEAVDVDNNKAISYMLSISGSTLKSYRGIKTSTESLSDDAISTLTPQLTATDTTYTVGMWGLECFDAGKTPVTQQRAASTWLYAPQSRLPSALYVVECDVTGDGSEENPYRPALLSEVKLGKDLLSVTYGVFDFKLNHSSVVVCLLGDNPYRRGAITEQVNYVKRKGLLVFKPTWSLSKVAEIHMKIKQRNEYVAGVHNLAYQVAGHEDLEPLAVADFYDGFTEGVYPQSALSKVPEWELERTVQRWLKRLALSKAPHDEREKHAKKLVRFLKK